MKKNFSIVSGIISLMTLLIFVVSCKKEGPRFCNCNPKDITITKSVFAMGLNNPRGLKFGPDGNLYVAEGGIGGTDSTIGLCDQVIMPVGPYKSSPDGSRISRIDKNGVITTAAEKIPSSQTSPALGGLISGVADVAFIGNTLYGLLAGAGCSHGVAGTNNGVIKVNPDKTWSLIADLSVFLKNNPVKNPEEGDFEPDGTWYSMISQDQHFFAVEPNHGELDEISTDGKVKRIIDISASQGHIVPTAITYRNGKFYVGNLNTFPIGTGRSNVFEITRGGKISVFASGFSTILGVLFDPLGGLYVLENTTGNNAPTPGTGDVIRVDPDGSRMTIVDGLLLPTAMTFGPDGKLYISNWGFGPPAIGGGHILQVDISCATALGFKKMKSHD
jgi:hypothetical protein